MAKLSSLRIAAPVSIIAISAALFAAEPPATAPATKPVPEKLIDQIKAQFAKPRGETQAEMVANFLAQMEKAISLGQQAEKEYADAPNLHVVRAYMIQAADFLTSEKQDASSRKLMLEICGRLVASNAPPAGKIVGDFFLTLNKVGPAEGKVVPADQADKDIRAFAARYAGTDVAVEAQMRAAVIARLSENKKLEDELASILESKHLGSPGVRRLLRRLGRNPDVGKPFKADLTRLDGRKLTLPDDLKGKVVVVEFWATWCPYCVTEMPDMKRVYEKYKTKGVEFVGISLDSVRTDLEKYLKDQAISWINAYSGKGDKDPTYLQYEIEGIPSVWVVGKDGKVVSDSARGQVDEVLEKALQ